MTVLTSSQRKQLEDTCVKARRAAEHAVASALTALAISNEKVPAHLGESDRQLRRGLRAKARQLGDRLDELTLLTAEAAYEQWHRLLFARFLAENDLLIHPQFGVAVTLDECEELATEIGEPDAWSVAARFAAEILPGIFRLDDPCVRLPLPPEGRLALEQLLAGLPAEIFGADDALGWVYQFWQRDRKDAVNASGVKVGGADLGPVTQLFTENYMVRFLLENSLGAWWAGKHPGSPLLKSFEYLRFDDNGRPAAGTFDQWPERAAEVTVMDPCCGSGHFLIEAFSMLWQMRVEEEGLAPVAAQDAVLRDNLFGLELDPRCVQIAMFNVALDAWKAGDGWRALPIPNIACSGIPVRAPVDEWRALAEGDARLESALVRLHILFRDADTLGSLIDPKRAVEITDKSMLQRSTEDVDWEEITPLLERAIRSEGEDPAAAVLGADIYGHARAADFLSRQYTLVTTNVPYLGLQTAAMTLVEHCEARYSDAAIDLATVFMERCRELADGSIATVTQLSWTFLARFRTFREKWLNKTSTNGFCVLGPGAFSAITGEVVQALLSISSERSYGDPVFAIDARSARGVAAKERSVRTDTLVRMSQQDFRGNHARLLSLSVSETPLLSTRADSWQGLVTTDVAQFIVNFWEVPARVGPWVRYLTAPQSTGPFTGRECLLRWDRGKGTLVTTSGAHNLNPASVLGKQGVLVGQGSLRVTLYTGEMFNDASSPVIPTNQDEVDALWAYMSSPQYAKEVRRINQKVIVGSGYLVRVPFDLSYWAKIAKQAGRLPKPRSHDPTQWLFAGHPMGSTDPLQVAVARLVGYRWPEQSDDDGLNEFVDDGGIVCLPSVLGEAPAADRLQALLTASYGKSWSAAKLTELLEQTGGRRRKLTDWLQAEFFKQHCSVFGNRPFVWHIGDGRADGFSALVNYHRLDSKMLQKLTFTCLGDWIERQKAEVSEGKTGAEARLADATELREKLKRILEGEPPYDIYVRWKSLAEQPIGWNPDVDDGVRLNIRPFVEAGVLRSKVNVNWRKDRGTNPDGSERDNDLHYTTAEKRAARGES